MNRQGKTFEPGTKKIIPIEDGPDVFPKTPKMKMLEYKYHCKLEDIILKGSLSDIQQFFHGEVDRATISRWRNMAREYVK